MPQMFPIMWVMLFMSINLALMMVMTNLFFTKFNSTNQIISSKDEKQLNWKW